MTRFTTHSGRTSLVLLAVAVFAFTFLLSDAASAQQNMSMYRLEWTAGMTVYEALLLANDEMGAMWVIYYDELSASTKIIVQTMELLNTPAGDIIKGYDPMNTATGKREPYYAADNFIFRRKPDGDTTLYNVDDRGTVAEVTIAEVETETELVIALKQFRLYDDFVQVLRSYGFNIQ